MCDEIAELVHGAALDRQIRPQRHQCLLQARRAIDDGQFRFPQAALGEIIEQRAPGRLAFPAHVLHGQQNLLPVAPDAEDDKERNRRGFAIEPDAHHRTIEDETHDVFIGEVTLVPRVPVGLDLAPRG